MPQKKKREKMSKKKREKMSQKEESNSSDQTDHVSKEIILTEFFNKMRVELENIDDIDDLIDEEYVKKLRFEEASLSKNAFQAFLRLQLKDACTQTKASSSVSSDSKTDPEASEKDTASSIETISEEDIKSQFNKYLASFVKAKSIFETIFEKEDINSQFTKYADVIKKYSRPTIEVKIEKILDTEEKAFRDSLRVDSKDAHTQTKASSSASSDPKTDLEASKKEKTTSSIETISEENIDSQFEYLEIVKKYMRSIKLKERETEEPKEEGCSKDTKTEIFSSPGSDLEVSKKKKKRQE